MLTYDRQELLPTAHMFQKHNFSRNASSLTSQHIKSQKEKIARLNSVKSHVQLMSTRNHQESKLINNSDT